MRYLSVLILLIISSCNKKETVKVEPIKQIVAKQDTLSISKTNIETLKIVEYALDSKAANAMASWQAYNDIASAIENFKLADFNFFIENEELFISTLDELETTIPERIETDPIKARLLVLKTKLYMLQQQLKFSNSSKIERLNSLKALFESHANVVLHINKKFEKEAQKTVKPY